MNLTSPEEYQKVPVSHRPIPRRPGGRPVRRFTPAERDLNYLFNTLYGFRDEGGGIWVVDVSAEGFHAKGDNFSRIVAWDHTLSWTLLDGPAGESSDSSAMHVFMTGKEVADDFAMTANILRIRDAGLESSIEREERLLQMVGWNLGAFRLAAAFRHPIPGTGGNPLQLRKFPAAPGQGRLHHPGGLGGMRPAGSFPRPPASAVGGE